MESQGSLLIYFFNGHNGKGFMPENLECICVSVIVNVALGSSSKKIRIYSSCHGTIERK